MLTREEYVPLLFVGPGQIVLKLEKINQEIYMWVNTLFNTPLTSCFVTYIGDCHDIS